MRNTQFFHLHFFQVDRYITPPPMVLFITRPPVGEEDSGNSCPTLRTHFMLDVTQIITAFDAVAALATNHSARGEWAEC